MTTLHAPPDEFRGQVVYLEGADSVDPASWDRLARRGFHLHHWVSTAERCGWTPRHVAVQGPAGLHAIVPAYLTGSATPHDLHHRWLGPLRDIAALAGMELRPVLSVQVPFGLVSEPLGDWKYLSAACFHQIFEALEQAAERDGAKAVAWPFVDADSGCLLDIARDRGYAVVYSGATARLRMRWASFAEYLASRSKNVRRTILADIDALSTAGLRTEFVSNFADHAAAMDRLYRSGFRRRNGRESPVSPELFEQLSRRPTPRLKAYLTWRGDRLVGTSLNVMTPQVLEGTFAAFVPEHRLGPALYNDLCYESIRLGSREGVATLDLGPSALYTKVLRGAVLQRRMILIRGTTPARHRLLRMLGQLMARRTDEKERRALGPLWGPRCFADEGLPESLPVQAGL